MRSEQSELASRMLGMLVRRLEAEGADAINFWRFGPERRLAILQASPKYAKVLGYLRRRLTEIPEGRELCCFILGSGVYDDVRLQTVARSLHYTLRPCQDPHCQRGARHCTPHTRSVVWPDEVDLT